MIRPLGLNEKESEFIAKILQSFLSGLVFKVYIFGSRAQGNPGKYSDIDLWIETDPPISNDIISRLRESFDESDLPISVDIVTPATCLESYKESIYKNRQLWFSSKK